VFGPIRECRFEFQEERHGFVHGAFDGNDFIVVRAIAHDDFEPPRCSVLRRFAFQLDPSSDLTVRGCALDAKVKRALFDLLLENVEIAHSQDQRTPSWCKLNLVIVLPGWIMALPIIFGVPISWWVIERKAPERYRLALHMSLLLGVLAYYFVLRNFEYHEESVPKPIAIPDDAVAV
jgi:hypothetical protein